MGMTVVMLILMMRMMEMAMLRFMILTLVMIVIIVMVLYNLDYGDDDKEDDNGGKMSPRWWQWCRSIATNEYQQSTQTHTQIPFRSSAILSWWYLTVWQYYDTAILNARTHRHTGTHTQTHTVFEILKCFGISVLLKILQYFGIAILPYFSISPSQCGPLQYNGKGHEWGMSCGL